MATSEKWHRDVTASIGGVEKYGKGILDNPWLSKIAEYERRTRMAYLREQLAIKIQMLTEPRFVTGTETSELMEALVTMTCATQILELGMHTGRTSLHLLRAIVGKPGAQLVSVDARPAHDREFFDSPGVSSWFQFLEGWTPQCLDQLSGRMFDFVFVDSAHDLDHTQKEMAALESITHAGSMVCLHDMPKWQTPSNRQPPPVRLWLEEQIKNGRYSGMMLPSPQQLDCLEEYGPSYPQECNPGLAVLIRK